MQKFESKHSSAGPRTSKFAKRGAEDYDYVQLETDTAMERKRTRLLLLLHLC